MTALSSPAPVITAAGLADIFARFVPFALDMGVDVDMRADYPDHGISVVIGVACTPDTRGGQDTAPILDAVRAAGDTISARLIEAQELTMLNGTPTVVDLGCLDADPSWPALKLAVEPGPAAAA